MRRWIQPYPRAYRRFVELFNRAEYRACVDPLEVLYFGRGRRTFYQGLIQLVVALLQLRLGMIRSPRVLLTSARKLLAPYAPAHRGLDVDAVLDLAGQMLVRLPEGAVQVSPMDVAALNLPTLHLRLRGPRSRAPGRNPRRRGRRRRGAGPRGRSRRGIGRWRCF